MQAAAKRARPSSSDTEHEPPQAKARLMPPPPPRPPSRALACTPRHKQRQTEAVKVLNLFNTDEYTIHLSEHSPSNLLHIWLQREQDTCLFSVRLVGNVDHPDQHVGIGLADLLSHSLWAKISYDHKDDMQTCDWTARGAVHVVVPVTTSPAAVRKVVEALYSGSIDLGDDAEEILLLASAMQVVQCGGCAVLCCSAALMSRLLLDECSLCRQSPLQQKIASSTAQLWREVTAILS